MFKLRILKTGTDVRHTPIDYAVQNGHTLVANFFESIGCDPPTLAFSAFHREWSKKRKIDD